MADVARFWDRAPRYLRPGGRSCPGPFRDHWNQPTHLLPIHSQVLTNFWHTEYRGSDWSFRLSTDQIRAVLEDKRTLVLGVFDGGSLVGTIVARPLTEEGVELRVGTIGRVEGAYMVEGLCVAKAWRGRHLAGWLISWVDYLLTRERPRMFLWSRESATGISTINITHTQYAYIRSRDLPATLDSQWITGIPWARFREAWAASAPYWSSEMAVFPTSLPSDCSGLHVWRHGLYGVVVVLSDTARVTAEGEHMWEVQWCGRVDRAEEDNIVPWTQQGSPLVADMLAYLTWAISAETQKDVILFACDAAHLGGATVDWGVPWHVGKSGYHTTYMYNYMPPAFWKMAVMLPRFEL